MSERVVRRAVSRLASFRFDNSLRARVFSALMVVFVAATAQTALNLWSVVAIERMEARSAESRRQLDLYRQLKTEVFRFFDTNLRLDETLDQIRARIDVLIGQIGASEESEEHLVRESRGVANDADERDRAARLTAMTRLLMGEIAAGDRAAAEIPVFQQINALLTEATDAERREVAANETQLAEFRLRVFALGLASIVTTFCVALYFAISVGRAALRPVRALTEGLSAIEKGDFASHIAPGLPREFSLIAESIDHMAAELKRKQEKLKEVNANLERIVQARTEQLKRANADLKRIDEDRKRFFADVSHELRTPLTTIAAEAEITRMIGDGDLDSYHRTLDTISAQAGFMRRRIDDLLAIARSEHGQLTLEKQIVDLRAVAREAVADVGGLLKASRLAVRLGEGEAPALVEGDERWLRQCVVTLLDNAIKFSRPDEAIDVTIQCDDTKISLGVRDYGEGISTANLPLLFQRFYQTEQGQRQGGTGVGLSIARWIVEQHGGRIVATNQPRGVNIGITLPKMAAS